MNPDFREEYRANPWVVAPVFRDARSTMYPEVNRFPSREEAIASVDTARCVIVMINDELKIVYVSRVRILHDPDFG